MKWNIRCLKLLGMLLLSVVVCSFSSGCATAESKFKYINASTPLSQGKGRVYFYRETIRAPGAVPQFNFNGRNVGYAWANGFFFVDCDPGDYFVELNIGNRDRINLFVEETQVRYVRADVRFGWSVPNFYPSLVDKGEAEKEIANNQYLFEREPGKRRGDPKPASQ